MKSALLVLMVFCSSVTGAQNINGIWKGTLTVPNACFKENLIEIQISAKGNALTGDSYHYQDIDYYVKKNFAGSFFADEKKVIIREDIVTTFRIRPGCSVCLKKYVLTYSRQGDKEILSGTWTGHIMETGQPCGPGTIVLTRAKESAFKDIPEVIVDTGTLRLDFYDNAEIDGDSITVLVNKKVLVMNQLLGLKPVTVFVRVELHSPFVEVEMKAENLGRIPPNTALLVVTTPTNEYRLFLKSTEEKSARVRFVYKEPAKEKEVVLNE